MKKFFSKELVVFIVLACLLLAAFILLPQIAHAQNTDTLHNNLTHNGNDHEAKWVFAVWAVMLGLADVVIVLILLVIAIVNILHLSYDTYALKKSLPLLIGGIIASHFSVLICRMIVDAAGVLEVQFMAADTNTFVRGLLCTMGIGNPVTGTMSFMFLNTGVMAVAIIILLLIIVFFAIAIGVLSFLLWFRKTVIFLLVAVSPLAFILYAFPPTQGLFKQWWSQFVKWVFMGPIMVALMWMASEIGKTNCTSAGDPAATFNIGAALAAGGIMFAASIVPMKMGGAIMGAVSNAGKWATGTGKGGYLKNPLDEKIQKKKDLAKMGLKDRFDRTGLGQRMSRGRQADELAKARYEQREKTRNSVRAEEVKAKSGLITDDKGNVIGNNYDREMSDEEFLQSSIERRVKSTKDTRVAEIYKEGKGVTTDSGSMTEGDIDNDEFVARKSEKSLESAKRKRLYDMARTDRGYELGVFENDILTTEKALSKVQEDKQFIIAGQRVARTKAIPKGLSDALQARDKAQDAISNTEATSVDRATAVTDLAKAKADIATESSSLVGRGHSAADVEKYINEDHMTRVEFTRQLSIMNPRVADDARTNITSRTAEQAAQHVLGKDPKGFDEGPNHAAVDDGKKFLNGLKTSGSGATQAVYTRIQEMQCQMENSRTAADGFRAYTKTLNEGGINSKAELEDSASTVLKATTNEVRESIRKAVNDGLPAGATKYTAANIHTVAGADLATAKYTPESVFEQKTFMGEMQREIMSRDDKDKSITKSGFRSGLQGNIAGYI